jgi:hypothetical protein
MKIENIIGKYIYFIDRNGAWRISKATSVHGNTITVQDATGGKERLHPTTSKIFGIARETQNNVCLFEPIEYGQIRIGKRIKNKQIKKEIAAIKIKPLRTKRPRAGRPKKVSHL